MALCSLNKHRITVRYYDVAIVRIFHVARVVCPVNFEGLSGNRFLVRLPQW